jgi:hypothetical protein
MSLSIDATAFLWKAKTRFVAPKYQFFPPGHECDLAAYELAYDSFAVDPAAITADSVDYGSLDAIEGDLDNIADVSQAENTPWATRVVPATGIGYVLPTQYSPGTNLSVPGYAIHTVAPQTAAFTPSQTLVLKHENPPSFAIESGHLDAAHFHIFEVISAHRTSSSYDRSYAQCLVHVRHSSFVGTRALSGSINEGSGGALLVVQSQLLIDDDSSFHACQAMCGGALTCLDSDVVCRNAQFRGCSAFFECGAAMVRRSGAQGGSWGADNVAFFAHVAFAGCSARELGGGLGLRGIADVTIDQCTFSDCTAGFSGGAAQFSDCNAFVVLSHFVRCSSGGAPSKPFDSVARGPRAQGGAIAFATAVVLSPDHNLMGGCQLATEDCCFVGNALGGAERSTGGADVSLSAQSVWQSYADRFLNHRSVAVSASAGASVRTYHSVFFGSRGRFFSAGHPCKVAAYEAAYDAFSGSPPGSPESVVYTSPVEAQGPGEEPVDVSVADPTPWQTRVPYATRLGTTTATAYTIGTNLSIPGFAVHSTATESPVFAASGVLTGSGNLPGSVSVAGSAVFDASLDFPDSVNFTQASQVFVTAELPESNSIAESLPIAGSLAFPGSLRFAASSAFTVSYHMSASSPIRASLPLTHSGPFGSSPTFTPRETLAPNHVETYVYTVVESKSLTVEGVSVRLSTISVVHNETITRVSGAHGAETMSVVGYTSFQDVWIDTVVFVPVVIPVYITTLSRVQVQLNANTPPPDSQSSAVLISIATSVGAILALFAGVAVFLCKKRGESVVSYSVEAAAAELARTVARRESVFGVAQASMADGGALDTLHGNELDEIPMPDTLMGMADLDLDGVDGVEGAAGLEDIWI